MDDERAIVAAALLDPEMRSATATGQVGPVVRAARRALGLTQTQLAERAGCLSQATISRLERTSTRAATDTAVLTTVAAALHLPPGAIGLASSAGLARGSRVDDVRRRDFLGNAAALTAAALLPAAIATPGLIGRHDVTEAWRALSRLFELDDAQGGVRVYEVAGAMATNLGDALRGGRYDVQVGEELRQVAATTMEHAGWLAFDAGQGRIARSWWLETIHLARDVGDVPTAHIAALASMSLQASGSRANARDTLSLAQAARSAAAARCTSTLSAVLAAREAVGHAHAGDRVAARTALRLARAETDRGQSVDDPLWLQFWSPADFACHETRVALALGDLGLAERSARTALASADERRFPRNHAIYSVRLGDVLTKAGKLDEAIAITSDAVKRSDQLAGSRRISNDLAAVVCALGTRDYQPAKSFARAALQWTSMP